MSEVINNILDNLNEIGETPNVIEDNKSSIVHKFTNGEGSAKELFSPIEERKYGEIVIDNNNILPSLNFLNQDGEVVSLSEIEVVGDTDILISLENVDGVKTYNISHETIECEGVEASKNSVNEDINVISNIEISETGHITKIESEIISKPIIIDVHVDGKSVIDSENRIAEISFGALIKSEEYNEKIGEIEKTIYDLEDIVEENERVTSDSLTKINEKLENGVKSEFSFTVDGISFDGSEKKEVSIPKNTAGITQYGDVEKLYLVGGERTEGEINKGYGKTYTDEHTYIENGVLYTKYTTVDEEGNEVTTSEEVATKPYVSMEIAKIIADAPDNLNTLKEIADFLSTDITGSATIGQDVAQLKEDNIVVKGTVESSTVLKDSDSKAVSVGSMAMGTNSVAGISGYYIKGIDTINNQLYLSNERNDIKCYVNQSPTTVKMVGLHDPYFVTPYAIGNTLLVQLNTDIVYSVKVVSVSGNLIEVDGFVPELTLETGIIQGTEEFHFTVYSYEAPNGGSLDLGQNAVANGVNTKALAKASQASGIGTQTVNVAETVVGKYNEVKTGDEATIFSVGVGTSDEDRKNAFEVTQSGDVYVGDTNLTQFIQNSDGKVATTEDIQINGGPLASSISKAYDEDVIPAGTTLEDFIKSLVYKADNDFNFGYTVGKMELEVAQPTIKANTNTTYIIVGSEINFEEIKAPAFTRNETKPKVTGFKYGYISGDTKHSGTNLSITGSVLKGDVFGKYTLSASKSNFIGNVPDMVTDATNSDCVLDACTLVANFGSNTYQVSVSTPSQKYGYTAIESVEALNNLKEPSGKKSNKLEGKNNTELTANSVSNSNSYTITGVYPVYTNISGGKLTDTPNTMCSLTSGNIFTFKDAPAENVGDKNPFMFEYPSTKTVVFQTKDMSGNNVAYKGVYTIEENTRTLKVGDEILYYNRLVGDGQQGSLTYIITLSSGLSVK